MNNQTDKLDNDSIEISLLFIYPVIMMVGIGGNILVAWLLIFKKKSSSNSSFFILNITFCDLISLGVSLSLELVVLSGTQTTKTTETLVGFATALNQTSLIVTGCALTAITIDRHRHIVHPNKSQFTKLQVESGVVMFWLFAVGFGFSFGFAVRTKNLDSVNVINSEFPITSETKLGYIFLSFFPVLFIPLVSISYFYSCIVSHLKKHRRSITLFAFHNTIVNLRARQNTKTMKILTALVITYFVCVVPIQVTTFVLLGEPTLWKSLQIRVLYFTLHILSILESCINPILYLLVSEEMRKEVSKIFKKETPTRFSTKLWQNLINPKIYPMAVDAQLENSLGQSQSNPESLMF